MIGFAVLEERSVRYRHEKIIHHPLDCFAPKPLLFFEKEGNIRAPMFVFEFQIMN